MIKAIFLDINGVLFEQEERFSVRYSRDFNIPLEVLNAYLDHEQGSPILMQQHPPEIKVF